MGGISFKRLWAGLLLAIWALAANGAGAPGIAERNEGPAAPGPFALPTIIFWRGPGHPRKSMFSSRAQRPTRRRPAPTNASEVDTAKAFGVSNAAIGKWLRAFRKGGPAALESGRGKGNKARKKPNTVKRDHVVALKQENKDWGSRRIRDVLARFERDYFAALADEAKGNVSEMARRAGMERAHVRAYLRRHGIGAKQDSD